MATVIEVSGSFSVCLTDMRINADTSEAPVNLFLCACSGDSNEGVVITKMSTNYQIFFMPYINDDKPEVTIHDGNKKIDCFLIKKEKRKERSITFMYNELTKTWCLKPVAS
jgi:hypothetical protein